MHISMFVKYDAKRLRRTFRFIARRSVLRMRILGGLGTALALLLVLISPRTVSAWMTLAFGLFLIVGFEPLAVALSMRAAGKSGREDFQMELSEEGVSRTSATTAVRWRWDAFEALIQTPDAWYGRLGRNQALMIPKDTMTEEQRAQFAAFVAGRLPSRR